MNKVFLIYSNYSKYCKDIIDNFNNLDDVNILCVDNPRIRQQVLSSKNFNITVVPTVIHISLISNMIYEGDDATNFINNIIANKTESITTEDVTINQVPTRELDEESGVTSPVGRTSLDELFELDEDDGVEDALEIDTKDSQKSLMGYYSW